MRIFNALVDCAGIFGRMDEMTPSERVLLFYSLETRWCRTCGHYREVCRGHLDPEPEPPVNAARIAA